MKRIPRFRDLPIGRKLAITFILTTVTALFIATFFYAYTSWQHEKETARTELLAVANMIGANSTAALAFDDAIAARETLSTLQTVPGILHGVLYDKNGEVLARFDRDSTGRDGGDIQDQQVSEAIDYQVSSPVELDNNIIGKVVLYATLGPRIQQLLDNVIMVFLASVTSLAIALLVAWRLQKSITNPVSQLAEVMQRVTHNNDYAARSELDQGDEIGLLSDGINQMLAHVQVRDDELEHHRQELESEVSRRTAALKEANDKLKEELEKRTEIEAGLKAAHQALERHHNEFALLSEMNDRLQVCHTVDEMRPVVSHYARRLFPDYCGTLFVYNSSRSLVEPMVSWHCDASSDNVFRQDDCWALRQGYLHVVKDPESDLICPHCEDNLTGPYICVPMIAYGEVMGILHLTMLTENSDNVMSDSFEQLAVSASERLALALANLHLREALQEQSVRDPLTGLFNRRYLQETMERELARTERMGTSLGIIMIDVDHFKNFNDQHGHEAGDLVLEEIGTYLTRAIRSEDIACRFGGEEFVVVMPGVDAGNAHARAEELRKGVNNISIQYKGQTLPSLSISVGVALAPIDGSNAEVLLDTADKALYQAKHAGRNRVVMATDPNKIKENSVDS